MNLRLLRRLRAETSLKGKILSNHDFVRDMEREPAETDYTPPQPDLHFLTKINSNENQISRCENKVFYL